MTKSEILSKFGKQFAASGEIAGVLQGIHYAADGSAVVTNRHYLLRIQSAHSFSQPITLHAKTGQPLEGKYPNVSKTFPMDFASEIHIPHDAVPDALIAAQCVASVAAKLDKRVPIARLEARSVGAFLGIHNELKALTMSVRIAEAEGGSIRTLNAQYLETALAVFAAADTGVTIKLNKQFDPIVLSNDNGIEVLILPYRTAL